MKLEDPAGNITSMKPEGDKVHLTQLHNSKEEFLHKTFIPMNNFEYWKFRQQYIIPDTPFTTSPRLDMMMVVEYPKSLKCTDSQLSRSQVLFSDAVAPQSGLIDSISKGIEVIVDDVEGLVKAAVMFLGNPSSQCTSLMRVSILEEYNKDMFSFCQVSQDMFASTLCMIFGPFLLRKHLNTKQIQTLCQARRANKSNQGFLKALHYA